MKLEHILLTTDLSDESLRAFEPIHRLAMSAGARVTLLYVSRSADEALGRGIDLPVLPTDFEEVKKAARKQMEELASSMAEDVEVELEVARGRDVADVIVEVAAARGADLIALSTHGRTGFRRMVLGSVAEKVLRKSSVPVLSIPRQEA